MRRIEDGRHDWEVDLASRYHEIYAGWKADPEGFWAQAAEAIDWVEPPARIFDADAGVYGHWFPDAICNTCHNAVDRHVAGGRADEQPRRAPFHGQEGDSGAGSKRFLPTMSVTPPARKTTVNHRPTAK